MALDDGSGKPLGYVTLDGELEVREGKDGSRHYHETELGQHMRWMRQAPDLMERYQRLVDAHEAKRAALQTIMLDARTSGLGGVVSAILNTAENALGVGRGVGRDEVKR